MTAIIACRELDPVDRLYDTAACPIGPVCAGCGATGRLETVPFPSRYGIGCVTVCVAAECEEAPPTLRGEAERVTAHCGHLGVTLSGMAAAFDATGETPESFDDGATYLPTRLYGRLYG